MKTKTTGVNEFELKLDEAAEILEAFRLLSNADKFKILYMIKGAILTTETLISD